ncbi:MAG: acetyl-CoA synthetase [Solirubrobacterales bacterium]|nr:acetyl-CoA synthetase [Solirubrobacterales bacterium]
MNFIEDVLERFPAARPALVTISPLGERRVWHFGELIAMSGGLSGAMATRGVHREDTVLLMVGNRLEWVLAMLACWRMGAIALPCNTQLRRKDLETRVAAANPVLAIGEDGALGELPGGIETMTMDEVAAATDDDVLGEPPVEPADLGLEDPALIVFTSGTTGEPRGALHPQRYLAGQATQAEHWFGAGDGDLAWCTAASGWSKSARNAFVAPWLRGAAALLHDGRFDPAERLEIAAREGVTVLCQAPTEYRMLAKRTELGPVPGMKRMVSAGEALNAEVIEAFKAATGLWIGDGYGQTETGAIAGMRPDDEGREGSMGRPLPGIETRIEEGELQLHAASSPTFFTRYLDGKPFDEEWWPTGDLVTQDDDGYLTHVGRADDLISSAGYRIGPVEVESALLSHPAVAEAAAVAAPDAERGSVVRAIVVLRQGEPSDALVTELQEHCKRVTAPYKYPRIVEFAESLPKTSSGKIKRAELREAK